MFKHLRVKQTPHKVAPDPGELPVKRLMGDATLPISIRALNSLPGDAARRIYRNLIPPALLARFAINPITWKGREEDGHVRLTAERDSAGVAIEARHSADAPDPFFVIDLSDNSFNGITLNWLVMNDPAAPRFGIDYDAEGHATRLGTTRRNLAEEEKAMRAGLAPGQIRAGLKGSAAVFEQLETFLAFLSHHSIVLEPLTYASAWVFERRGLAYVRGHRLMDRIHAEFQPGGQLHAVLDGSTPFRQPDQWRTVRGRAWAIHDGLLAVLGTQWNEISMIKQIGRRAGVETAAGVGY